MNLNFLHQFDLSAMSYLETIRGPLLDQIMLFVNACDGSPVYFGIIAIVWFAFKQKSGLQLLLLFAINAIINQDINFLFSESRPHHEEPSLGLLNASILGISGGAAYMSTVILGYLCLMVKKVWFWFLSIILLVLMGTAHVYLGTHYVSNVLTGWLIGGLILCAYHFIYPLLERFFTRQSKSRLLILCLLASLFFSSCSLTPEALLKVFLGFGGSIGVLFAPPMLDAKALWEKILRPIIAIGGVFSLTKLSELVSEHPVGSAICLLLIGFWVGFGVPFLLALIFEKKQKQIKKPKKALTAARKT